MVVTRLQVRQVRGAIYLRTRSRSIPVLTSQFLMISNSNHLPLLMVDSLTLAININKRNQRNLWMHPSVWLKTQLDHSLYRT